MRSYFYLFIIIASHLSAIVDSDNKQPLPPNNKGITIGPPPGTAKLIRHAQEQAFADGTFKPVRDTPSIMCIYGTIGVCATVCVSLALYTTLTKMSMSIN